MNRFSDCHDLEPAIDLLYAAVTDSTQWEPFLKVAAQGLESTAANILISTPAKREIHFSALWNLDPLLLGRFAELSASDPRNAITLVKPGMPLATHRDIGSEAWHASRMFRELFVHAEIDDSLTTVFSIDEDLFVGFALLRPPGARPYDDADVARYCTMLPHLRRAGLLLSRFLELEQQRWSALAALDGMPMGVVVADMESRLIHANALARVILADQDGLSHRHGQLWAGHSGTTAELRAAIRTAVTSARNGRGELSVLTLPRDHSDRPLRVRIAGFADEATVAGRRVLSPQPVALLYIIDPDRPQETLLELLQRLYGLTSREVELAANLARGLRLDDCAREMGITTKSARTYLKSVFGKMNVSSQADVVRLVLSEPVWGPSR